MTAKEKSTQLRTELVNNLLDLMEKDGLQWSQGFDPEAFLVHNPLTPTRYKGINRFVLVLNSNWRGLKDPRYCTFKQASDKGWKIKKGSHGTTIEKWKRVPFILDENGERKWLKDREVLDYEEDKIGYALCLHGTAKVFSYEDIEGVPQYFKPRPIDEYELTEALMKSSRCKVTEGVTTSASYAPNHDYIKMPPRDAYDSVGKYNATLLHEMAHSTMQVFPRDFSFDREDPRYAIEELRAELASAFVSAELGIPLGCAELESHAAYLQYWVKVCREDTTVMERAITDAQKIADYLIQRVNDVLDQEVKAA